MASRPAPPVEHIDVTPDHVHALLARVRRQLADPEYRELEALIETLLYVTDLVTRKTTSIARLRALLIGACTETTRDVLARVGVTPETPSSGGEAPADPPTDPTTGLAGPVLAGRHAPRPWAARRPRVRGGPADHAPAPAPRGRVSPL